MWMNIIKRPSIWPAANRRGFGKPNGASNWLIDVRLMIFPINAVIEPAEPILSPKKDALIP